MSHYDDEAQIADLKKWWQDNWKALAAGLVLGLGGIGGWEGWQAHQTRKAEQASQIFDDLKRATQSGNEAEVRALSERLKTEFINTPYAVHAALFAAQQSVAAQDWSTAQKHLAWAGNNATDQGLKQLARLREARVLWQSGQADAALKLIPAQPGDSPFASLYEELRGDIRLAQGDKVQARASYEKALPGAAAAHREYLQRKLDDLAESPAS